LPELHRANGNTDILICVEDPGAANYVAQLPAALAERGWRTKLMAVSYARDYLAQRGLSIDPMPASFSPDDILASLKPQALVVGTSENPDALGLQLVAAARRCRIESVGVIDAFGNAAYRFRGHRSEPLAYAPDWLLVPDAWTKEAFCDLGYPGDKIVVCGHPHYDLVLAEGQRLSQKNRQELRLAMFPQAPADAKVVVFVAEISGGLNPEQYRRSAEYTLVGKESSLGRTEVVLDELLAAIHSLAIRPYLVLRLHPKNTLDEFAPYLPYFHQVSTQEAPVELVYAADIVVGMTSMMLLEAAIVGCPTLSIVPRRMEMDWLPSIRKGVTPCATTRGRLQTVLRQLLEEGVSLSREKISEVIIFGSLDRVKDFLDRLLHGKLTGVF
jgi:hypothetical protein